jgi:hypothetical protein
LKISKKRKKKAWGHGLTPHVPFSADNFSFQNKKRKKVHTKKMKTEKKKVLKKLLKYY